MARPALSARRAVAVLNFLAAHPREAFTLSSLATRLGINLASAHAVLAVLEEEGYVTRHPRHRTYTLGSAVVALGDAALEQHPAIDLARQAAHELATSSVLEVAVSTVAGDEIVFLARAGQPRPRGVVIHVGQRLPYAPPLGSVFAAWRDSEEWLARAADRAGQQRVLDEVRGRGYAIALDVPARRDLGAMLDRLADEPIDGHLRTELDQLVEALGDDYPLIEIDRRRRYDVSTIAAPVFDGNGQAVLALTLVGFGTGLSGARVAALGEAVRDSALLVTRASGGRAG